jgi:hypothetical protein
MSKVIIGAPSLNGKGALEVRNFESAKFPLKLTLVNLVGFALAFPEANATLLHSGSDDDKDTASFLVKDYDSLVRLGASIEAIAELNNKAELVLLTDDEIVSEPEPEAPAAEVVEEKVAAAEKAKKTAK